MIATVTVAGACGGSSKPVEGIRLASSSAADGGREVRVPIGGDNLGERALRALMFEARRQGGAEVSDLELHLRFETGGRVFSCVSLIGPAEDVRPRLGALRATPGAFAPPRELTRQHETRRICRSRQVPVKRVERTPKTSGGQPRTYTVFQTRHTCENRPRLRNITTYPHREQNNWPQVSWQRLLEPYTDAQIVAPTPEVCVPADGEMHSYLRASIRAH